MEDVSEGAGGIKKGLEFKGREGGGSGSHRRWRACRVRAA